MKETSSEGVLHQPIQKLDILQLAFGDGTPKKSFFHCFGGGQHFNQHQSRRHDFIRRIPLLAQNCADLLRPLLCYNLGSDYRKTGPLEKSELKERFMFSKGKK